MKDIILTDQPLSITSCEAFVSGEEVGGISIFVGIVRNQTKGKKVVCLEFEAYEPMAISEMKKIAQHILIKWPAHRVAIHHRTGRLEVGETAVIIAVSCAHRKAAFEASQYAIDILKQTVPIWKKEIFEDGETWVAAHP